MSIAENVDAIDLIDESANRRVSRSRPAKKFSLLGHPATPFYSICLIPIFWLMGLGFFTFVIAAAPMGISLLTTKPIRFPKGFGIWFLYVGWMMASVVTLNPTFTRFASFGLRIGPTIAATIIFLYIYNLPEKYLPTGRVLGVIAFLFVFTAILGGYLGLALGETTFPTLLSQVLPRSILTNEFVGVVIQPPFAQTQDFLGFPINRPSFPFSFSNDWAATLAPASFAAIAAAGRARRARRWLPVFAILAIIPMVVSANRGLWIALIGAVLYVAARRALTGKFLHAAGLIVGLFVAGIIILVSPLGEIAFERSTTDHSTDSRGDIYTQVIDAVPDSPLLGYGAPISNPIPFRPAIGTHGNFWTALFSQGIPGAIFYTGFWFTMTFKTGRRIRNQEQLLLHLAVATSLPTMFYYDHLPAALPIMMMCLAVFFRDQRSDDIRRREVLAVPSTV